MMKSIISNDSPRCVASLDETEVPDEHGLYEIHIAEPKYLPSPFCDVLSERNQTLLYIGKAEGGDGIRQRLFRQDLRNIGHATFFRSLGVVLGHMKKVKPLKRGNNFSFENSQEIVDWIKIHLWVSWQLIPDGESIEENEKILIKKHGPVLNIQNNLDKESYHYRHLKNLRGECRKLARERHAD